MACEVERGPFGTIYTIYPDNGMKRGHRSFPPVEAWWTKNGKGDSFIIRQENTPERADVLELSHRQLYDLLDAINRAIGLPGPNINETEIA